MVRTILRQVLASDRRGDEQVAFIEALRRQMERALKEERWRFADRFCDRILAEEPNDLQSWLVKGHLAWRYFDDPAAALSCFRKVVILGGFESSNACVAQARASLERLLAQLT